MHLTDFLGEAKDDLSVGAAETSLKKIPWKSRLHEIFVFEG